MTQTTVKIGKREFKVDVAYAPKRPSGQLRGNRTFLGVDRRLGGITYRYGEGEIGRCAGTTWAAWAGDEVKP